MKIVGYTHREADTRITSVEAWWDKTSQNWIIQSLNAAGDEIGDAVYVGHKTDAAYAAARAYRNAGTSPVLVASEMLVSLIRKTDKGIKIESMGRRKNGDRLWHVRVG